MKRATRVESSGDSRNDCTETLVDLGMGAVVRVTVTAQHVDWEFMQAGSSRVLFHRVAHAEAGAA